MVLVIFSQLIIFALYPFMDTTEARYADIARRMLENKDWITPWFDENMPFWGKPPLSFWFTLIGFKIFGLNEFGGRFFYWVSSVAVLYIISQTAKLYDKNDEITAPAILLSFLLFYMASSAVMTDMPLLLGACMALYAQVSAVTLKHSKSFNSLLLGLGVAIGMLAKGPISLILFLLPLLFWSLFKNRFQVMRDRFTFWKTFVVAVALSLPWYLFAELKTPGFLEYFFIGEHWNRYLIPGWKGDLYGSAHDYPRGSIWLFYLLATMPWTLVLVLLIPFSKNEHAHASQKYTGIRPLLLLWIITPLVFFTFSGNVLWTYVLPALPATAILIAEYLPTRSGFISAEKLIRLCLLTVVGIKLAFLAYLYSDYQIDSKTTKYLLEAMKAKNIALNRVYFLEKIPFSAKFYSNGQAKLFNKSLRADQDGSEFYLVVKTDRRINLLADRCTKKLMQTRQHQVLSCR